MQPQQQMPPIQQPPQAHSTGAGHSSKGSLIASIIFGLLTFIFIGLFIWAYMGMQDYKNNTDKKVEVAVSKAVKAEGERKDNEFTEKEKSPVKEYKGPSTYGSVSFEYPKTWSGYVVESDKSTEKIDGYFHPGTVPDIKGGTAFALRIQVVDKQIDEVLKKYDTKIKKGTLKSEPYSPLNVEGVKASKITGEINTGQQDTMYVMQLRDKTLVVWAESDVFVGDLDNFVLKSLKFSP